MIEDISIAHLFKSDIGNIAKPVSMALGALIIQNGFQYSNIETVNQIRENPYLQYFVGLLFYRDEKLFDASMMGYTIPKLKLMAIMTMIHQALRMKEH